MDVVTGLATISQALGIVRELRDLDASIGKAEFKLKIVELTEVLADTKVALSEAKVTLADKDERISELKRALKSAKSGEQCEICGQGTLKTTKIGPHPKLGKVGIHKRRFSSATMRIVSTPKRECTTQQDY
ncbi:MAG: hypothetical protein ACI8R4_002143 [Paracoccaceae bacterium]|jgi:hypothetical protein